MDYYRRCDDPERSHVELRGWEGRQAQVTAHPVLPSAPCALYILWPSFRSEAATGLLPGGAEGLL